MYKSIYNDPIERQRLTYTWCFWDGAFTPVELNKMCKYFSEQGVERGTTVGKLNESGESEQKPDEAVRVSNVKFYNVNEDTSWIFERMNWVIEQVNERFYNYNLNGYDTFQYTEYDDFELGRYDFHQDMLSGKNMPSNMYDTRKLSMSLLLNEPGVDFEGGEFQINSGKESEAETIEFKRGRMVFFPSYAIHRVAPVTKGRRKSLVVWVTGPKFI